MKKTTVLGLAALAAISCSSTAARPGDGGAGGAGDSLCPGVISPACVVSCSQPYAIVDSICVEKAWRCPDGSTPYATCPAWSCARLDAYCCDPVTGEDTKPGCGPDGMHTACANGLRATTAAACIPDSVPVTHCASLYFQTCTREDLRCWTDVTRCECIRADGGLAWSCGTIAP